MALITPPHSLQTLDSVLTYWSQKVPTQPALLAPDRAPLSFGQLGEHLITIRQTLRQFGMGRTARVALLAPNGPELASAFLGVASAATCAPLNPAYRHDEIAFYLDDLEASLLLIGGSLDSPAREVAQARGIPVVELLPRLDDSAGSFRLEGATGLAALDDQAPNPDDIALILHTSGTTARPKQVPLSHTNLCASIRHLQQSLALTPEDRCVNLMPLFHIHGLVGALLATLGSGGSLVCPPGFMSAEFFGWLRLYEPTWYTAVPTIHQAILAQARTEPRPLTSAPLRFVRSSSASLPPTVMADLETIFNVPVIEAYGMTEAAHQMASNPLPPGIRKPGSVGLPAGPEVAILSEAGEQLSMGEVGEVSIRGANVMTGYTRNPTANTQAFTDGWFRTGDQGYFDPDGYLFLTGRFKELINRGGEKIAPLEIDQALLAHPAVVQAVTFALPHPTLGEDVGAAVVLESCASVTIRELQTFLAASLAAFKIPRQIVFVSEVPKGPTGKLQRIGLAKALGIQLPSGDSVSSGNAPRTPLETTLVTLWHEVLDVPTLGVQDDFFALGGDSLSAMRLLLRLRERLHVDISFRTFFGNLTIASLAELIEETPRLDDADDLPLRSLSSDKPVPLSFAQQRLWFLEQLEPGNPAYHCPVSLQLRGPLDTDSLEKSLTMLVARHEVLRTTFPQVEGIPMQVVAPPRPVQVSRLDWRQKTDDGSWDDYVHHVARQELQTPFDLAQGPVLRAMLLRQNPIEHILLLTFHHIVIDDGSQEILLNDLAVLYEGCAAGKGSLLPALTLQYRDVAVWERTRLKGEYLAKQVAYWRQQLANLQPLELSTDRPQPPVQNTHGASVCQELSPTLTAQLYAVSQQHAVTPFMTLMAAFQVLLYRYTGHPDIAVGTPIANRQRTEVEGIFGFFANTLVLRGNLSGNPSFAEFLEQIRKIATESFDHQDVPFEHLVEVLTPPRDLSRTPFFQVLFDFQSRPLESVETAGLQITPLDPPEETANFDLTLAVCPVGEGLVLKFKYKTDLFNAPHIERMLGHFERLIEGIITEPATHIAALPLLTEAECQCQLVDWNATTCPYPSQSCLHHLFEQQAARTPDSKAVVFESQALTYQELNGKANQLAKRLQSLGVGSGDMVPVLMERSLELVISYLAILKVGAAFSPLDPEWPRERLVTLLTQLKSKVVAVTQDLAFLPQLSSWQTVIVDATVLKTNAENVSSAVQPDDPVYILFTSGSTGTPKGAINHHRGLVNRLWNMQQRYLWSEQDVVLVTLRHTFDASLWQYLWPLLHGARLVLPPPSQWVDLPHMVDLIEQQQVTLTGFVPSVFALLVEEVVQQPALRARLRSLRQLMIGGEALQAAPVNQFRACCPGVRITNTYGPTEASISTIYYEVPDPCTDPIPLGRPLKNVKAIILDDQLNLVPVGVPGELHLGGVCVGLGYLNNLEATQAAFIPNPFPELETPTLYKTGDRACFQADGTIRYLGRRDHQVKINGVRMELGEIEAVLGRHPKVKQSIVVAWETPAGGKRLVAYGVRAEADQALTDPELKGFLSQHLPTYMIPSTMVILDQLPLLPNGKVDRHALPAQDSGRTDLEKTYVPPQTTQEKQLAEIWRGLLKIDQIGIHDNFFELGGHSLMAMQVIARTRVLTQSDISVRTLFEAPTLAEFAEAVQFSDSSSSSREVSLVPALRPRTDNGPIPLSSAQQRLWFLDQWEPESLAYHVLVAWSLRGPLDRDAFAAAFMDLIGRHESLRTTFHMVDGQPVQVIHSPPASPLPLVDLATLTDAAQETALNRLMGEEAHRPFDLTSGPLIRGQLIHLRSNDHVLLVTLHHIVTDGWSMRIFWKELSAFYTAKVTGHSVVLPPLPIQYADFSVWQRQWLKVDVLDQQLAYWITQLGEAPPALALPTDAPRPAQFSSRGAVESFTIPPTLTQRLKALSQQEGVTLFMSLLATFQVLLARYADQREILVGTPIAGRTHSELEGLIGFFTNTLVLRTSLQGNPTVRELLGRVREVCIQAYTHQEVPFEKLVEVLRPIRDPSRNPLFQVMFQLITQQNHEFTLPGLTTTPQARPHHTAKFDLSCTIRERDGALHGDLEYCTALFEAATITHMIQHFHILLEGILQDLDQPVIRLPLLTATERQKLVVDWNPPAQPAPDYGSLHQFFEVQVEKTPEAVAGISGDEQLTYRQLSVRANQFAHYLQRHGVGPEVCVGLCVDRSLEMLIGLLGILKAGGVCVPLDPTYPAERLTFMATQANVRVLVTQSQFIQHFSEYSNSVICLDIEWAQIKKERTYTPQDRVTPANLVYVLYTSGSTGRPKGVALPHAALVNLIAWHQTVLPAGRRTLQFASISFDVSFFELFSTWGSGGTVIVATEDMRRDTIGLLQCLAVQRIEKAILPSVLLPQLAALSHAQDFDLATLHDVITTGDELHITPAVRTFFTRLPACRVHNYYGPTECHVVTAFTLDPTAGAWSVSPSIGSPIANTQIWLVDREDGLVPPGVLGELHIGGVCLARSYLHQPDLTAERFRPSPVHTTPGARAYQSGDHGRHDRTGAVHFLGRRDHQIKLRGFRIELGEIEAVLGKQPEIQEIRVLCREDNPGDKQLVAYVVPAPDSSPDPGTLRTALKTQLPDYMVPTAFVMLETFPLTSNGKVDKRALPAPALSARAIAHAYLAPQTILEEMLAGVWEELLNVEGVGRHDDFFVLGGHSLLATQLLARLKDRHQIDLPLRALFDHPRLIDQARAIEEGLLQEIEDLSASELDQLIYPDPPNEESLATQEE